MPEVENSIQFLSPLQSDQTSDVEEGEPAHFEAIISSTSDDRIVIKWLKDNVPVLTGSRFNAAFYRGHVELDILYTIPDDTGNYSCVIENQFGQIFAQSNEIYLSVIGEDTVHEDLQQAILAQGVQSLPSTTIIDDRHSSKEAPKFLTALQAQNEANEGDDLNLIVQLTPLNDSSLKVEWYKDNAVLTAGSRVHWDLNKGFSILHIGRLIAEDSGIYYCIAKNSLGEAKTNEFQFSVAEGVRIVTSSNLNEDSAAFRWIKEMDEPTIGEQESGVRYNDEVKVDSAPQFEVKLLHLTACEGGPAKFLVRVNGHPEPQLQWYLNDEPIYEDSNNKVYRDGPISCMEIHRCEILGPNKITVIASNALGQSESIADLIVLPLEDFRPDLKHIKPENPYKKMQSLRKVQMSPELSKKLTQAKPSADAWQEMERESFMRSVLYKSPDVEATEKLYDQVAANLRKHQPKQPQQQQPQQQVQQQ